MPLPAAVWPTRTLAFPFAAVLFSLAWFLLRDVGIRFGRADLAVDPSRVALLVVLSVVASYVVAALVVAGLDGTAWSAPGWASSLVSPSDATVGVFVLISVLLAGYAVAGTVASIPDWVDLVATPVGVVLGWPLLVAVFGSYAVGNALGTELPFLVEAGLVAVGVVVAVAWLFVLSSWIATLSGGIVSGSASQPS